MRTGLELIGKPIYGITDGRQIGTVKDLYLDEDLRKVSCIYLSQQSLLGRRSNIIQREDVDELYIMGFTLGKVFIEGPIAVRGAIAREALLESLSLDEKIIIDLSIAEEHDLGVVAYT